MRYPGYSRFAVVAMITVASMSFGCNSSRRAPESEKAIDSMSTVSSRVADAKAKVDSVTSGLDQLSTGTDLATNFKNYSKAVDDLKAAGDKAAQGGQAMRDRKAAYLDRWDSEMASVQDPSVKQSLQDRRTRVQADFDKITQMSDDVKQAYRPFLSGNQDIQKALAIDLNPDSVKSLAPAITKAKADGTLLSQKLDALGTEMNGLIGRMSPSGTTN